MRMRLFGLAIICSVLPKSISLIAQAVPGNFFIHLALPKLVPLKTFTTIQPTVFHLHGHAALCYELHIVNINEIAVELSRVQVLGSDGTTVLLDRKGKKLAAALYHSRGEPAPNKASTMEAGEQIVFYSWVQIPVGSEVPASICHRLMLRQQGAAEDQKMITPKIAVRQVTLEIESPLRGSNWLAANGPSNFSSHRRTFFFTAGNTEIPQRYAIDWLMIDKSGNTFSGDANRNESYFCYGQKVHAVANGVVTGVRDEIQQNIPGAKSRAVPITLETVGGNHVIVDLGSNIYALYAHLQPGSIRVKLGDHVKLGQVLGLLGNSGNSTEPHLHFQLIDHSSPLNGEGVPYSFRSYRLLTHGTVNVDTGKENLLPNTRLVRFEIPAENDLVQFAMEDQ